MLILPKKKRIFREVLNFNIADTGSVVIGNSGYRLGDPKAVTKEEFERSVMQLGFFGGSSDSNKFYENLKASDIMPKPEHFVDIPMRFISATIVGGNSWKATDFRQPGVLKASVSKLNNKVMYKNHEQEVDNWVGLVADPYWEDGFISEGTQVPDGISGFARIEVRSNPKVATGLLMGAIQSNSVTPVMRWEASHSFETAYEFYDKIGTMGDDGQMIRRIVLDVEDYLESSLVWMGADPFAKIKKGDGSLMNIDKSNVYFSKAATTEKETFEKDKKYFVVNSIDEKTISLSKENYKQHHRSNQEPQKTDNKMNKFLIAFMAAFGAGLKLSFSYADGMTLTDAQQEELAGAIGKLSLSPSEADRGNIALGNQIRGLALAAAKETDPATTQVDITEFLKTHSFVNATQLESYRAANSTVTELATELSVEAKDIKPTVVTLKAEAKVGTDFIAMKRAECKRLYGLSVGEGKEDAAIVELIDTCKTEQLDGLLKQYGGSGNVEFSAFCSKCKSSENIEMRSSIPTGTPDDSDKTPKYSSFNSDDIRRQYTEDRVFMNGK